MANSSRDPYWQASVRRETIDHPARKARDRRRMRDRATCRWHARSHGRAGRLGEVFVAPACGPQGVARPPFSQPMASRARSATRSHPSVWAHRESFTGGFVIRPALTNGPMVFGPFRVDPGRARVMHSADGRDPDRSRAHPAVGAVRDLPHALHESAGATRRRGRLAARAGAIPGVAAQRAFAPNAAVRLVTCRRSRSRRRSSSVLGEPRPGLSRHASSAATSSCSGC